MDVNTVFAIPSALIIGLLNLSYVGGGKMLKPCSIRSSKGKELLLHDRRLFSKCKTQTNAAGEVSEYWKCLSCRGGSFKTTAPDPDNEMFRTVMASIVQEHRVDCEIKEEELAERDFKE